MPQDFANMSSSFSLVHTGQSPPTHPPPPPPPHPTTPGGLTKTQFSYNCNLMLFYFRSTSPWPPRRPAPSGQHWDAAQHDAATAWPPAAWHASPCEHWPAYGSSTPSSRPTCQPRLLPTQLSADAHGRTTGELHYLFLYTLDGR